jgi:hypothetical protein
MSRLVYGCRFDVQGSEAEASVLKEYKRWVERHYNTKSPIDNFTFDFDGRIDNLANLPSGHHVKVERLSSEAGTAYTLEWSYPSETDQTLLWRNEVRIGTFGDGVALEHAISIDSIDFRVAPAKIDIGSPRVIRRICTGQTVRVGEMHVRATPYRLDVDGIDQFTTLLESPLRRIPIVFLAPYTDDRTNEIDEVRISAALAGVAVVVQAVSGEVTWEIADILGRTLSCYDGAARIYWPGFSINDDPRRHPLYLANRIEAVGPRPASAAIERAVFSVATFRFVPDPRINAVIRAAEHTHRVEQIEERKAEIGADWEQYALDLDVELTSVKSRLTELEAENENLRANQKVTFTVRGEDAEAEILPDQPRRTPVSSQDAVAFAEQDFENLVVLETALQSAEASPFRRPSEIYDALRDLDIVAQDWSAQRKLKGAGGDLRQHLINRGWGKRCSLQISDTTRSRYRNNYTFEYKRERKLFEPHITIGSGDPNMCASIHFILDQEAGKIVVAHVGRHLPNTKT